MNQSPAVAVIGLGRMGAGMAATLLRHGYHVYGVDPVGVSEDLQAGGLIASELEDVAQRASTVVLSLPSSDISREVLIGANGIAEDLAARNGPNSVVIDMSTGDPRVAQELARRLDDLGVGFVDAPVSGGPKGARGGTMTAFVGGSAESVARATPVLTALTSRCTEVGGPGNGQLAKLINNGLCAVHLAAAGEALALAEAWGAPPAKIFEAVNAASGRSAVTELNVPEWVLSGTFDSGFSTGLMARDVGLATGTAGALGIDAPLFNAALLQWQRARESFGADADFNRIVTSNRAVQEETPND